MGGGRFVEAAAASDRVAAALEGGYEQVAGVRALARVFHGS